MFPFHDIDIEPVRVWNIGLGVEPFMSANAMEDKPIGKAPATVRSTSATRQGFILRWSGRGCQNHFSKTQQNEHSLLELLRWGFACDSLDILYCLPYYCIYAQCLVEGQFLVLEDFFDFVEKLGYS